MSITITVFKIHFFFFFNRLIFAGIQLADELGFKESLSSLEQNSKRRSVNGFAAPGSFEPLAALGQDGGSRSVSAYQIFLNKLIPRYYRKHLAGVLFLKL